MWNLFPLRPLSLYPIINIVCRMLTSPEKQSTFHLFLITLAAPSCITAPLAKLRDQSVPSEWYHPGHYHHRWRRGDILLALGTGPAVWASKRHARHIFQQLSQKTKPEPHDGVFSEKLPSGSTYIFRCHLHRESNTPVNVIRVQCTIYWHRM